MSSSLVLLGTGGGPTPKKERNAFSVAVRAGESTYLIDAGNGVARMMAHAGIPFNSIRAVGITHHHSDHNADVGTLLHLAWCANLTSRVSTFGPAPWTRMWGSFLDYAGTDVAIRRADEGRQSFSDLITAADVVNPGVVFEDDNIRVTAAWVNHPPIPALAYRIDAADRSYVVSGDTTPCDSLVELARGADVLVHEVMHVPSIEPLVERTTGATIRKHLLESHTASTDVGTIAERAGVEHLVLAHFVPASPAVPDEIWAREAQVGYSGKVTVGSDLMVI